MKVWFKDNWDKVLFPVLGIIVSGVVGFYTALNAVDAKISAMNQRVTVNETEIKSNLKPKISTLDALNDRTNKLLQDTEHLKRQNDISVQTNKLLDLRIEQQREKTLKELSELVGK